MSVMSEVLKALDVDYYERFKLHMNGCTDANLYFFDAKNGLMCDHNGVTYKERGSMLADIIIGKYKVVKLPWVPKIGDGYYYPSPHLASVQQAFWSGTLLDLTLYALGMAYRTEEKARANLDKDCERLTIKELEG